MVSPEVKDWIHGISIVWWRENTPFWTAIPGQSSRIWSQETRGWNRYRYSRCLCWKSLESLAVCQTLPLMLMLVHLDSKYIAGLSPSISLSMCTWNQILSFIFFKKSKTMSKTRVKFGLVDLVFFRRILEKFWVDCFLSQASALRELEEAKSYVARRPRWSVDDGHVTTDCHVLAIFLWGQGPEDPHERRIPFWNFHA